MSTPGSSFPNDAIPLDEQSAGGARSKILQAALELVERGGLKDFSLREVARRSGYSPASLYEYFDSKEALLAALQLEVETRLSRVLEALPPDLHPSDHLIALGMAYVNFSRQNPGLYELLNLPLAGSRPVWTRPLYQALSKVIQAGIDADEFKTRPGFQLDALISTCWFMLHGMAGLQNGPLAGPENDLNLLTLHALEALVKGLQISSFS